MKKLFLIAMTALTVTIPTFAGGILTNTNQHAAFLRMISRGATISVDGAYYNPAGLSFLPKEGLYFSITNQSAFQERIIDVDCPINENYTFKKKYTGTAAAPIIPSFQAAYKRENVVISGAFAVSGGGGKASFGEGLPLFSTTVMGLMNKYGIKPDMYSIESSMNGSQYIFGAQLGISYKVNDWLGVYAGGRMNYVSSGYDGFLTPELKPIYKNETTQSVVNNFIIALDCDQSGWGVTPIIGADIKYGKFNIGIKYEFMTNLNIENKTKEISHKDLLGAYADGVNTPNDIPALFSIATQYSILPNLRASIEYHHFDDKNAEMADNKQKYLTHGTNEILASIEWDINKILTISGGYQNTNYGLADQFQSDTSFYCDSYSLGFGAAINLSSKLRLNAGYFWTDYDDYKKVSEIAPGSGINKTEIYARTNKVFGMSLDYKF